MVFGLNWSKKQSCWSDGSTVDQKESLGCTFQKHQIEMV